MRNILLVCYYFPPLGGAGVARPLALVRYLPEFGYDCHVLTVKPVAYRLYEPELLDDIPDARIYRSGSNDPQRLMYMLGMRQVKARTIEKGRPVADSFFPDSKIGWVRPAVRYGRTLLNNRNYHAIVSTSPPISSHLVARKLAREFHRPWIADFRDYWTIYKPEDLYATRPLRRRRAKDILAGIRKDATALTAVNGSVGEYVGADRTICNSFDNDLASRWVMPGESRFTIGVLGTINDTTPIEPLFRVLAAVRDKAPEPFADVRVRHVGQGDADLIKAQAKEYGLENVVEHYGVRPRLETVQLLSEASLLYIGVASEKERGLSTGRIYTMLSSGRPILASVPPGAEIEALIEESSNGRCFFDDIEYAVDYVRVLMQKVRGGESVIVSAPSYAEKYSARTMASQFADLLDQQRPSILR